jgi:hypothetical protein
MEYVKPLIVKFEVPIPPTANDNLVSAGLLIVSVKLVEGSKVI